MGNPQGYYLSPIFIFYNDLGYLIGLQRLNGYPQLMMVLKST